MDWTLEVVVLPVSDIDRAIEFYRDKVGFHLDHDTQNEHMHVVQLTPEGSGCSIVFGDLPPQRAMEPGSLKGLQLCVADAEAARRELLDRGVEASELTVFDERDGGTFFGFSDPDGNTWAVQELRARGERPLIPPEARAVRRVGGVIQPAGRLPILRPMRASALALAAVCLAGLGGAAASATRLPGAPACPVFPADNAWNQRVDRLPVASDSDAIVRTIGLGDHVHADFGSGLWEGRPIGIPVTVVTRATPRSRVGFEYADESDRVAYPIPANVRIEGGSDRHALLVDRDACLLYELFALRREGGRWSAGSGAVWSLRSNRLRPAGWTSADAAGLPILPGLARFEDVARGRIDHALRVTVSETRRAYVWPARHFASSATDASLPRMGERLRLKRSFAIGGYPRQARIVLQALKEYGAIVADNGSDWYVSGAPDPRWSNDQLHSLHGVPGSAFEVVDARSLRR